MRRLRFWWAQRRNPTCDGGEPWARCGRPSVAGFKMMGITPKHVCAWHLEPIEEFDNPWFALNFLARWMTVPA